MCPHRNSPSTNARCLSTTVHHHYHYLSHPSPSSSPSCYNASNHSCNCKSAATFTPSSTSSTTGSTATHISKASSNTINSTRKDPGNHTSNHHQLKQYKLLTHAIQELIQSERDYVDELYIMVEICLAALHQQKWASAKHVDIMSRNLSDIFAFHQRFLSSLRAPVIMQEHHRQSGSSIITTTTSIESKCRIIARAFLDHQSDFMSLYIDYCEGHSRAWKTCTDYRSKSEWPDFLLKCQGLIQAYQEGKSLASASSSTSPLPPPGKRIRFEDFLIKPIQRICRYQLLLKEIIRHANQYASITQSASMLPNTSRAKRHSHQLLLAQSFDCMHTIATEIDRQNEAQESRERTHRFLERLDSDWRLAKDRVAELGYLVISGALDIRYQNGENSPGLNDQHTHEVSPSFPSPPPSPSPLSKSRYLGCFVFSSYVIIVQVKKQTLYEAKHWFPLHVVDLIDQDSETSDFILQCQQHTFICTASCMKEKQTWVDKIRSAKSTLSQKNVDHDGLVSSLNSNSRLHQSSPPLLRSSTTFFDTPDQNHYHPHRSHSTNNTGHLPSSSSSPSLAITPHYLPLSLDGTGKKKKNRSLSTHITSTRYLHQTGSQPSSPTFRPSNLITEPPTRRHSSLDLFSMATQNLNRMSLHFKTQHRNALRDAVDQRIRDVCTRDYLSSRARYFALDRKTSGASAAPLVSSSTSSTSSSLLLSPSPSPPPMPTSTAISSSSISSTSSIPSPGQRHRTPSPLFLHPLASPPLSFNHATPISQSTRDRSPLFLPHERQKKTKKKKKKDPDVVPIMESSTPIELPPPSGKANLDSTPDRQPKKHRGLTPRFMKSLWHHLTQSLKKKKSTKKQPTERNRSSSHHSTHSIQPRPIVIEEKEEEDMSNHVGRQLPSSPSVIMYSDFQLYRRSLNLE
ncbi:hypothetical protein BC941DRAFT_470837 [Chlamydoabsidia padenii]|nr:hypothetical protein BC941DRAFT_470837 [Chlamydoabsidia padenii]